MESSMPVDFLAPYPNRFCESFGVISTFTTAALNFDEEGCAVEEPTMKSEKIKISDMKSFILSLFWCDYRLINEYSKAR